MEADELFAAGPRCLRCDRLLDDGSALDLSDARPKDGDVSVCLYCGHVALFCFGATAFRLPSPAEERRLMTDPRIQVAKRVAASAAEVFFTGSRSN
jgi:DNA-directed RNA polymerase subunit RPC12/RpoP